MKRPWLAPLVPLYRAGLAWRALRLRRGWEPVRRLQWPVVSIGNLSTGGSGKTPLAIALAKLLTARGVHVDVLSRGYGRQNRDVARVHSEGTAEQYGDEPLLIARQAGVPVYVASQRYDAGLRAERDAAAARPHESRRSTIPAVHILDDGFQHRQLARAIDILLLNRADWEDSLLPAGNLREARRAAERAHVLAIPAEDLQFESQLRAGGWLGPVWRLHRHMEVPQAAGQVFALCGIARPEQFFAGLTHAGLRVAARKSFRDHYDYTEEVVAWILKRARGVGASALVTTEKDEVRMGALAGLFPSDLPLCTARLQIEIENHDANMDWLVERLAAPAAQHGL
jgi:tetraacyldisaccharide 4'-kinase